MRPHQENLAFPEPPEGESGGNPAAAPPPEKPALLFQSLAAALPLSLAPLLRFPMRCWRRSRSGRHGSGARVRFLCRGSGTPCCSPPPTSSHGAPCCPPPTPRRRPWMMRQALPLEGDPSPPPSIPTALPFHRRRRRHLGLLAPTSLPCPPVLCPLVPSALPTRTGPGASGRGLSSGRILGGLLVSD